MAENPAAVWEYTLTGFNDFLEQRRIGLHGADSREPRLRHLRPLAFRYGGVALRCKGPLKKSEGVKKEDLESLREQALGELDDEDDLVNAANGLIERVANLGHSLSVAQERGRVASSEKVLCLTPSKSPAPGPYRPASKPGVFITTCEFSNVYAARNLLTQAKKEHRAVSEPHRLSGYTFRLDANFLLSGGEGNEEVSVRFSMYLKSGDWDDYVEWPFSKKVTVIIAHPRDATKDVRLPLCVDGSEVVRKPRPTNYNCGRKTEKKSWEDIELGGYIVKNTLFVHVEFE
ncbi:hypothetical protein MTO96_024418 [Rhipicephalus appendiculatus]